MYLADKSLPKTRAVLHAAVDGSSEQTWYQPTPLTIAEPTHPRTPHKGLHPFVERYCVVTQKKKTLLFTVWKQKNKQAIRITQLHNLLHGKALNWGHPCQGSKPMDPPASAESF